MTEVSLLYPLAIGVPLLILAILLFLRLRRGYAAQSETAFEYPDATPPGGYDTDERSDTEDKDTGLLDRLLRYVYPYRRR